jgi:hypothetical protein
VVATSSSQGFIGRAATGGIEKADIRTERK